MPPQAATAPARPSRLMPTPMPPCKIGRERVFPRIVTAMLPP